MLLTLVATVAMAVPAKRGLWKTVKLADGTEVKAELCGDERFHFWRTEKGEKLVNSGDVYVIASDELLRERRLMRRANVPTQRLRAPRKVNIGERTNYEGEKKGLVILVNYKDIKFKTANNLAKYKKIMNEEGYTTSEGFKGSVSDYFKAQSRGKFELDFDVVGPYTLKNNRKYYGANDASGYDVKPEEMIIESCKAADEEVDFNDYDWDGDGYVDQVFVLYAGVGEASSFEENSVWPHMSALEDVGKKLKLDGINISTYACSNEVNMNGGIEGIGCFCHEFSHCMGFPDFYDTSYSGNFGMSEFDLMDQGSYNGDTFVPAGYSAHEKMMCGWQEPIELADDDVTIENLKALSEGGESYIIYNKAHPDEYYMLENRQKKGWDAKLPAAGLMITHVDFDKVIWYENTPNTNVTKKDMNTYGYTKLNDHQRCTIFHADNEDDSRYWDAENGYYTRQTLTNDLYPYRTNDSLTNASKPAAKLYNANTDGTKFMNRRVLNIKKNTASATVSFEYKAKATDDQDAIGEVAADVKQIEGTYYNLAGQRIKEPVRGLYIVNGRKVVVR